MEQNTGVKAFMVNEHVQMVAKGKINDLYQAPESEPDYLCKARWIYSMYCYNNTIVSPGGTVRGRSISELRAYGNSAQDISKYKQNLLGGKASETNGSDPELNRPFNYAGISWDPTKIYAKFKGLVVDKLLSPKFDPTVIATDSISGSERAKIIARDRLNTRPEMRALSAASGADLQVSPIVEQMDGDVDAAISIGSYLLPIEAGFQDAIGVTLAKSNWPQLNLMIAEDIINLGIYSFDTKINPQTRQLEVVYVDPAGLICPSSVYPDCHDIPFCGYIKYMNIGELREMAPEIEEKDWYQTAKAYSSYGPNLGMRAATPQFNDRSFRESYHQERGRQVYDPFATLVLTCYFKECEYIDGVPVQFVYSTKWIVGTDITFDSKKESGIGRKGEAGNMAALLPMVIYYLPGPSMTEKVIADIDDLQIATYKLRALIASIPPGERRVIDLSGLSNAVTIGEKSYNMLDMLAVERKSGTLIIQSEGMYETQEGTGRQAITPIESTLFQDITIYQNAMNTAINNIRLVTGINEAVDGSAKSQDMLIGVMQGLERASNSALSFEFEAGKAAFVRVAEVVGRRYHSMLAHGDIAFTSIRMTTSGLYSFSLLQDMMWQSIDIMCVPAPSQEEIDFIRQAVIARVQENKIDQASSVVVLQMLSARNVKAATVFMAKAIEKHQKAIEAAQASAMNAQAEAQQRLAQTQSQAKMELEAMKHQQKMEYLQVNTDLEIKKMEKAQQMGVAAKAFEIEAGSLAIQ
jgi:hypothetical protein